jgi:hypothetical protein
MEKKEGEKKDRAQYEPFNIANSEKSLDIKDVIEINNEKLESFKKSLDYLTIKVVGMKARFDQALLDPLYETKYRLKQLLKKAAENSCMLGRNIDIYNHNLDTTFQNEFDLLISDESTISGKTLINSMEMLNKNIQTHDERKIPK